MVDQGVVHEEEEEEKEEDNEDWPGKACGTVDNFEKILKCLAAAAAADSRCVLLVLFVARGSLIYGLWQLAAFLNS